MHTDIQFSQKFSILNWKNQFQGVYGKQQSLWGAICKIHKISGLEKRPISMTAWRAE